MSKTKASILGICRLRIGTDGHGVRTLVAFMAVLFVVSIVSILIV